MYTMDIHNRTETQLNPDNQGHSPNFQQLEKICGDIQVPHNSKVDWVQVADLIENLEEGEVVQVYELLRSPEQKNKPSPYILGTQMTELKTREYESVLGRMFDKLASTSEGYTKLEEALEYGSMHPHEYQFFRKRIVENQEEDIAKIRKSKNEFPEVFAVESEYRDRFDAAQAQAVHAMFRGQPKKAHEYFSQYLVELEARDQASFWRGDMQYDPENSEPFVEPDDVEPFSEVKNTERDKYKYDRWLQSEAHYTIDFNFFRETTLAILENLKTHADQGGETISTLVAYIENNSVANHHRSKLAEVMQEVNLNEST